MSSSESDEKSALSGSSTGPEGECCLVAACNSGTIGCGFVAAAIEEFLVLSIMVSGVLKFLYDGLSFKGDVQKAVISCIIFLVFFYALHIAFQ